MWIMVPWLISHKLQLSSVRRFDSAEVGETNYYYSHVSQQLSFESFFCFLLGSDGNARLDFAFSFTLSHPVSAALSVLV